MGENFEIKAVESVNEGTLIQIDFKGETTGGRMFLPIRDVFKALNNYLQTAHEHALVHTYGFTKEDPDAPVANLID